MPDLRLLPTFSSPIIINIAVSSRCCWTATRLRGLVPLLRFTPDDVASQIHTLAGAGFCRHSFGEQFSQKKWTKEIAGQREILAAYGGVKQEDIRGMRAPFLAVSIEAGPG